MKLKIINFGIVMIALCIVVFNSFYDLADRLVNNELRLWFALEMMLVVWYLAYNRDLLKHIFK